MTVKATENTAPQAYEKAKKTARHARSYLSNAVNKMLSGGNADDIVSLLNRLEADIALIQLALSAPNFDLEAQDQERDMAYQATTEYTALVTLMLNAKQVIHAQFPKDASNYILLYQSVGDTLIPRSFGGGAAQAVAIRAALQAVIDNIVI